MIKEAKCVRFKELRLFCQFVHFVVDKESLIHYQGIRQTQKTSNYKFNEWSQHYININAGAVIRKKI